MADQNIVPISYQIAKIKTEKFATYNEVSIDENDILIHANANFKVSVVERSVRCTFEFSLMSGRTTFIEINTSVYFLIQKDSWDILPRAEGKREIPLTFAFHMTQATLSTARGILHAKTEGSHLNKFFIPDLNAEDFVKTRLIIEE